MVCPQCKNKIRGVNYECQWCGFTFNNKYSNNNFNKTKKLARLKPKVLFGVCAGIANYFSIDVSFIRLIFVFGNLFFGLPFIAYIIMAIVIPRGY